MTAEYARTEWDRALEAFTAATLLLAHGGFDSAASRAYYAVFHAASALFALEGTFTKHSALRLRSTGISSRREDGQPISGAITASVSMCVESAITGVTCGRCQAGRIGDRGGPPNSRRDQ